MTPNASAHRPMPAPPARRVALTGTGRLADDVYLLAHHEVSGRPYLQPRAVGLGLAGALLAELAMICAVRVAADGCAVTGRVRPGAAVRPAAPAAVDEAELAIAGKHCDVAITDGASCRLAGGGQWQAGDPARAAGVLDVLRGASPAGTAGLYDPGPCPPPEVARDTGRALQARPPGTGARAGSVRPAAPAAAGEAELRIAGMTGEFAVLAGFGAGQAAWAAQVAMFRSVFDAALRLGSDCEPACAADCALGCGGAGRSRMFAAVPGQVRAVRDFVRLGLAGHPAAGDAVAVASELAANSVAHGGSGRSGGMFTVHVAAVNDRAAGLVLTELRGDDVPEVRDAGPDAESGRGLVVVRSLTSVFQVSDAGEIRSLLAVVPAGSGCR
jgi:serine/threonine-protein kinase RsbW